MGWALTTPYANRRKLLIGKQTYRLQFSEQNEQSNNDINNKKHTTSINERERKKTILVNLIKCAYL